MTMTTIPDDARVYLAAVRSRLDDLPADEREDLLADVESAVLDSADETDAPIAARLGSPERFADELRTAAGLPPRTDPPPSSLSLRNRLAPWAARLEDARELLPLWWVARAIVAVGAGALIAGDTYDDGYLPGSIWTAAAAVAVSVAIGLRHLRRTRLTVLANVALVLAALPVLTFVADRAAADDYVPYASFTPNGIAYDGAPVRNLFAFDREGRLLTDVRLYNQDGLPLDIGRGQRDPGRRVVRTRGGAPELNAFPVRYFEPGTRRIAQPRAGVPRAPQPLAGDPMP
ncbi:MAG: hypothetical protein WKF94_02295 [Solirubrobacteraceae bacterium]